LIRMEINRNNYEAYLLDLVEGRLSAEQERQVRDFILMNPGCTEGMEDARYWSLEPENIPFPGKEKLLKVFPDRETRLTPGNFDLFSIARMEGDLTRGQVDEHEKFISGDQRIRKDWEAWQRTRLVAGSVLFSGKEALKKKNKPARVLWISVLSGAAAVILAVVIFKNLQGPDPVIRGETNRVTEALQPENGDQEEGLHEQATEPLPRSDKPVPGSDEFAAISDKPVTLSIKKHQDPPELTGEKDRDKEILERVQAGPLKRSMLGPSPLRISENYCYDRIVPLDLPPVSSNSASLTWAKFSEQGLKQTYRDFIREKDLSLLTIASAGIEGINRLTGSELNLNLTRDREGQVSGFRFRSPRMSVDAPVNKPE
jgi:hypothetical protein